MANSCDFFSSKTHDDPSPRQMRNREGDLTLHPVQAMRAVGRNLAIALSDKVEPVMVEQSLMVHTVAGLVERACTKRSIDANVTRCLPLHDMQPQ